MLTYSAILTANASVILNNHCNCIALGEHTAVFILLHLNLYNRYLAWKIERAGSISFLVIK